MLVLPTHLMTGANFRNLLKSLDFYECFRADSRPPAESCPPEGGPGRAAAATPPSCMEMGDDLHDKGPHSNEC